jgi:hypothetical protein
MGGELPSPAELLIIRYEDTAGYWLIFLDDPGEEMGDHDHRTLAEALEEAEAGYRIERHEWEVYGD